MQATSSSETPEIHVIVLYLGFTAESVQITLLCTLFVDERSKRETQEKLNLSQDNEHRDTDQKTFLFCGPSKFPRMSESQQAQEELESLKAIYEDKFSELFSGTYSVCDFSFCSYCVVLV
jgi:hypothetical protein